MLGRGGLAGGVLSLYHLDLLSEFVSEVLGGVGVVAELEEAGGEVWDSVVWGRRPELAVSIGSCHRAVEAELLRCRVIVGIATVKARQV